MNEDLLDNIPETPVYTTRTIVISSLFGGIIAAGYMIWQNFKSFGDPKKAKITILLCTLAAAAIFATVFVPALENIPGIFFTLFITLVVSFVTKKYQGALIEKHIRAEGKLHTSGRAVLVCIISMLIIFAAILGIYFLLYPDASLADF